MFSRSFPASRRGGFTLLELLVVIGIIAILAAIMFPAFTTMQNASRKTQALSEAKNLVVACFNYKADYGKLPMTEGQRLGGQPPYNSDTVYGNPGDSALYPGFVLMDILRAVPDEQNKDHVLNPSQTVYFNAPFVKNSTEPRSGLLRLPHQERPDYTMKPGTFVDPWGSEYVVWIDVNNDYNLNMGMKWFYEKYPEDGSPHAAVMALSMGVDGEFGKDQKLEGSDDVYFAQ